MISKTFDVVIVGGGVIGASLFAQMSNTAGVNIALLEKSSFGLSGPTVKSGGMLRTYHPDSYLSDLALESMPHFMEFEERYGGSCGYNQTGLVIFEPAHRLDAVKREVDRINRTARVLEWRYGHEAIRDFGHAFRANDQDLVIFEARAGYASPVSATKAWINYGREYGHTAVEGTAVHSIVVENGKVVGVETSVGSLETRSVIIAAGAWSKRLLEDVQGLSTPLRVKAIQMNSFTRPMHQQALIPFIDYTNDLYGKPEEGSACAIGLPVAKWDFDPDVEVELDAAHLEHIRESAAIRFPWLEGAPSAGGKRSFDAYTADGRGWNGDCENIKGLYVCTGWSGGGFKIAPAVAKRLAIRLKAYLQSQTEDYAGS